MRKVRQEKNLQQMYANLLFELSPSLLDQRFLQTDFGKLYQSVPFKKLAQLVPKPKGKLSGRGCKSWLTIEGGIALLIAKHYLQLSDAMLIERLNTDWSLQMFCGIQLKPHERIKDDDLPGRWRSYLGKYLDIDKWQLCLAKEWKVDMDNTHVGLTDATCYESYITYPTDAKLIWKSCNEIFGLLNTMRKQLKLRRSRANHDKHKNNYLSYSKLKKKTKRKNKKLCRSLLKYLDRLLTQMDELPTKHKVPKHTSTRFKTIEKIKQQQWSIYFGKESKIPNRIVSLHKPYVRPIVRGKETKPVEFGAKVNKLQVNGVSFIEHLSFDAFNEGTRFTSSVNMQKRYFGKCSQMGADAIYATNKNRKYSTENNIATSFVAKGKQGKNEEQKSQMRTILGKARSTTLEGSFGNEKNHYLLNKIKARTQATEIAWIFFGMLASNAVTITKRRTKSTALKKAA
jgi:IS5 family transposase